MATLTEGAERQYKGLAELVQAILPDAIEPPVMAHLLADLLRLYAASEEEVTMYATRSLEIAVAQWRLDEQEAADRRPVLQG